MIDPDLVMWWLLGVLRCISVDDATSIWFVLTMPSTIRCMHAELLLALPTHLDQYSMLAARCPAYCTSVRG